MEDIIKYFMLIFPPIVVTCIVVFILVFHFYNTIRAAVGDFLKLFGNGFKYLSKKATAYQLEGKIGNAVQKVTTNKAILPHGLTIEWSKGEERSSFLRGKKVVVVLNKDEPEDRQFARAIMELVRQGLIPASKVRLDKDIIDTIDTKVAQSIVAQKGVASIRYFEETFLIPFFNHEENKRRIFDLIKSVERNGMLYQLLLNEYEEVANEALNNGPNEVLVQESADFFKFVSHIANKKPNEIVQLTFLRQYFRVSVILATKNGLEDDSLDNYVAQIQKNINNGVWKIYIYALGRKVERAQEIAAIVAHIDGRVTNIAYQSYTKENNMGEKIIEGICIELSVSRIGI